MISATEMYKDVVTVDECKDSNIEFVKASIEAYGKSLESEKKMKGCIAADANILSRIGIEFLKLDEKLKDNIKNIMEFDF